MAAALTVLVAVAALHDHAAGASATAADPVVPHELVAQEGGTAAVMRRDGDRLWAGIGPRLVAIDIAVPSRPRVIGRSVVLPGTVEDLAVGSVEPNAAGAPSARVWALVGGDRLVGIDARDPEKPAVLASAELPATAVGIARVDDHVWAVTPEGSLVGFDVLDPRTPRPAARLDGVVPRADAIGAVPGHLVIQAAGHGSSPQPVLHVVDVRDAGRPVAVGVLMNPDPDRTGARCLYVADGTVWLLYGTDPYGLYAVDVGTPSAPAIVGQLELPRGAVDYGDSLTVADGRAYVMGGRPLHNVHTLAAVDVGDPLAPRLLAGGIRLPRTGDPSGGVAASAEHLWYGTVDGLLLGVSGLGAGAVGPVGSLRHVGWAETLDVDGARAVLGLAELALIVDLSARRPRVLAQALAEWYPGPIHLEGTAATVLTRGRLDDAWGGLHVVDVADPAAPRDDGELFADRDPLRFAAVGLFGAMIARVGSHADHQVVTLDRSSPFAPVPIGELVSAGGFRDVAIAANRLYAAGPGRSSSHPRPAALVVADVTDPARPIARGRLVLSAPMDKVPTLRLAVDGDTVFLVVTGYEPGATTATHNMLHVVHASDPDAPAEICRLPLSGVTRAIAVANGYAFLPGDVGVRVIDVRSRAHPLDVGVLPTSAQATDAVVEGGLVYVTALAGGLYVFAPHLPGWPDAAIPTDAPRTPTPTRTPGEATYGLHLPWVGREGERAAVAPTDPPGAETRTRRLVPMTGMAVAWPTPRSASRPGRDPAPR